MHKTQLNQHLDLTAHQLTSVAKKGLEHIRYNQLIESRLDIKIAGPEPHIQIATSELGDIQVFFTIFCPTESAMEIEQKLTADFMRLWFQKKEQESNC